MIKLAEPVQAEPIPATGNPATFPAEPRKRPGYVPVLLHVLVWLLFFSLLMSFHLFIRPQHLGDEVPRLFLYHAIIQFGLMVALFYFNAYFAIPRLLFRKRIAGYITLLLVALVVLLLVNRLITGYAKLDQRIRQEMQLQRLPINPLDRLTLPEPFPEDLFRPRLLDPFSLISLILIMGVSTSLMVTLKWFKDAEARQSLEKEHLTSELSLLKNQINPHFFFNTLNNIYALTEANPEAQEAIYRLSRMMRYMLYETEQGQVALSKEIDFIKDYVELMRLRLPGTLDVQFHYPPAVGNLMIAPLIFIAFIENAFKHGVSYNERSYVHTELKTEGDQLHFRVTNRLLQSPKATQLEGSGIGLTNVRRRLDLLYPGRYLLHIKSEQSEYRVHLTIQFH